MNRPTAWPRQTESLTLVCDHLGSIVLRNARTHQYTPYGYDHQADPATSRLGFTGQLHESALRGYLLGNGYRCFNPVLMRFNSPDSFSPFDAGGANAYAYCGNDPLNNDDSSGHFRKPRGLDNAPHSVLPVIFGNIPTDITVTTVTPIRPVAQRWQIVRNNRGQLTEQARAQREPLNFSDPPAPAPNPRPVAAALAQEQIPGRSIVSTPSASNVAAESRTTVAHPSGGTPTVFSVVEQQNELRPAV